MCVQNIKWITWTTTIQANKKKTSQKGNNKILFQYKLIKKNKRLISWNILPLSLYFTKCRNDTSCWRWCSQCLTLVSRHRVSPKKPWRTVGSCTDAKEGFKIIFILLLVQTYSSCSLQPSLASSTSLFATRSTLIRTSDSALMVLALSRASLSFGGCYFTFIYYENIILLDEI